MITRKEISAIKPLNRLQTTPINACFVPEGNKRAGFESPREGKLAHAGFESPREGN